MKIELCSASILLIASVEFKGSFGFLIPMPITSNSRDNLGQQLPTEANTGESFWLVWFPDKFYLVQIGDGKSVRTLDDRQTSRMEWAPLKKSFGQWQIRDGRSAKLTSDKVEIQKRATAAGSTDPTSDTLSSSRFPRKTPTSDNPTANLIAPREQRKPTRSLPMDDYDFNAWEDGVKMRQAKPAGAKRLQRSVGLDAVRTNPKISGKSGEIQASPEENRPRIVRQGLEFSGGFRVPSFGDFIRF